MRLLKKIFNLLDADEIEIPKLSRNDPCWCGSGKKYKRCHMEEDERKRARLRARNCTGS